MQIRKLLTDEEAVSPVIGVILMVAITVILAAVIGAFVLGFGDSTSSAPTASWDSSENDPTGGGDLVITFEATNVNSEFSSDTLEVSGPAISATGGEVGGSTDIGAGYSFDLTYSDNTASDGASSGDEVDLIWSGDDSTQTLYTHEISQDPSSGNTWKSGTV